MYNKKINFKLKIILVPIIAFILFYVNYGEKIAELPQVLKPFYITIDQGMLYISEYSSKIHIFELKKNNVVFKKTFGKVGEGPGEFQFIHRLAIKENYLEIPTFGKYARFAFDGKLIDEVKLPFRIFKNGVFKIGSNYLTRSLDFIKKDIKTKIKLWGPDLKLIKELGTNNRRFEPKRMNFFSGYYSCLAVGNNIYIVKSDRETIVKKYDKDGNHLGKIKLPLEPIKFDARLREKLGGELTGGLKGEELKDYKKRLYFPDSVPGLNYFNISNNIIITRTFQFKDDKSEFVFFDMEGKELKRKYLHDTGRTSRGIRFCYSDNYFYYIKENQDEEIWELFAVKVFN